MQENYAPWDLDTRSLHAPADLLRLAVLAPSSHNSQPWKFTVLGNTIRLSLDPSRCLKASDTNDRQAIISLGCAAENIAIGAEYYGYDVHITSFGADGFSGVQIILTPGQQPKDDPHHLIHFIPERTTNRRPYESRIPDADILDMLHAHAGPDLFIDIITDTGHIGLLGDIAVTAGIDAMEDRGFRYELSHYLRSNTTQNPVGMPGVGFGFPAAIAYIAPLLVRFANMSKLSAQKDRALFTHTPAVVVISTTHDTQADWFATGRAYERAALIATKAGMSTAPWGAPIQIGEHYRRIQETLSITSRPQFLCRLGYPTSPTPHTPRLAISDVQ